MIFFTGLTESACSANRPPRQGQSVKDKSEGGRRGSGARRFFAVQEAARRSARKQCFGGLPDKGQRYHLTDSESGDPQPVEARERCGGLRVVHYSPVT